MARNAILQSLVNGDLQAHSVDERFRHLPEVLARAAADPASTHDIGAHLLPPATSPAFGIARSYDELDFAYRLVCACKQMVCMTCEQLQVHSVTVHGTKAIGYHDKRLFKFFGILDFPVDGSLDVQSLSYRQQSFRTLNDPILSETFFWAVVWKTHYHHPHPQAYQNGRSFEVPGQFGGTSHLHSTLAFARSCLQACVLLPHLYRLADPDSHQFVTHDVVVDILGTCPMFDQTGSASVDKAVAYAIADIFPSTEHRSARLHSVVNPVHGKQGYLGAWYAPMSRFEGASPSSVLPRWHCGRLLWSWVIFIIIIIDGIVRIVGIIRTRRWAYVLQAFLQAERLHALIEARFEPVETLRLTSLLHGCKADDVEAWVRNDTITELLGYQLLPALPFLRRPECHGMVGSVVALFTAEGGLLDEGSIAELFGNWTYASSLTPWKYATRLQIPDAHSLQGVILGFWIPPIIVRSAAGSRLRISSAQ
ncbi:hypothetical protein P389DRAFT_196171 [Cystobasidium minutum MCA 4210]|uniref:uncharacterized protein n=1 Tax=Cystobasidium minutum MCA 4210 TaxID=1397322 RepID=UPI0034CD98FC|eukprot:jgi/Rhomi1/196171/gm1.4385_g